MNSRLQYRVYKWDGSVDYISWLTNVEAVMLRGQGLYVIPL